MVNEYRDGRLPLFHLDLYRLATRGDIIGAGLEAYLTKPAGVAVVEWIERWLEEPPGPSPRHPVPPRGNKNSGRDRAGDFL